tara:strand:- start:1026 stop:1937 length:912 start_codon:yes stop_codon:yes gene_type:complete
MKRYSNNDLLYKDPIRSGYNTTPNTLSFNQPINKIQKYNLQQLNNPNLIKFNNNFTPQGNNNQLVQLNKGIGNDSQTIPGRNLRNDLLPKEENNSQMIPYGNNNLINFNNEINKFKYMSEELMNKDEEIQKYKNELYKLQLSLNDIQKEQQKAVSSEIENKLLRLKLNEQYNITKEITELKHKIKKSRMETKDKEGEINMLKRIIHKQYTELSKKNKKNTLDESESSGSEYSESEYSESDYESEEEEVKTKPVYKNSILKDILKRHIKAPEKRIDKLFFDMKITEKTKITKPLLVSILNTFKK